MSLGDVMFKTGMQLTSGNGLSATQEHEFGHIYVIKPQEIPVVTVEKVSTNANFFGSMGLLNPHRECQAKKTSPKNCLSVEGNYPSWCGLQGLGILENLMMVS